MTESHPIITDEDIAQTRGSDELKRCPFCGSEAISAGSFYPATGNTVYQVICTGLEDCGASVHCCSSDEDKARATAIKHWNRRRNT